MTFNVSASLATALLVACMFTQQTTVSAAENIGSVTQVAAR
jgi:hypothetical protein